MPSVAFTVWRTAAVVTLDEVEAAHAAIGGTGRGRRYATGQINNAYVVLLSSQFQRFCRDLHTEAAEHISGLTPFPIQQLVAIRLTEGRRLDTGNPNRGNLGSDYNRFDFVFWDDPRWAAPANVRRRDHLEQMNEWRNAIAHQDFNKAACNGRTAVTLAEVRRWRRACDGLATVFDCILKEQLAKLSGIPPW